ncbi:MAG TPA: diaminopimelate epimerase [bacterium]|nr:diaminopimelate epimerase [bacterium]
MNSRVLNFTKMSGLGNDFIVFDNRDGAIPPSEYPAIAKRLCPRRISVGADGILVLENHPEFDFRMHYLNPDGTEAMCGNGARCLVRFAHLLGVISDETVFLADDGAHRAFVRPEVIRLELTSPRDVRLNIALDLGGLGNFISHFVNVGVPHAVIFVNDLQAVDVNRVGRMIRYHQEFAPAGTNVNFVMVKDRGNIEVRTYERGVEDETLACGTGSTASALVAGLLDLAEPPVHIFTRSGGSLSVDYTRDADAIRDVFLTGDATVVYKGEVSI